MEKTSRLQTGDQPRKPSAHTDYRSAPVYWRPRRLDRYGAAVQGAQAGLYDVTVCNAFGCLTSGPAMLSVNLATTDGFNPAPDNNVWALAVQPDAKILVGGEFSVLGGSLRPYAGRVTSAGTADSFNPNVSGFNVMKLAVQDDTKVLLGGYFFTIAGQTHNRIGRVNSNGTVDPTFNAGANEWLYSLVPLPDGRVLVGSEPPYFRRLNNDGSLDAWFTPFSSGPVHYAALQADGKVLAGGRFPSILRLNQDGSLDPTLNAAISGDNLSVSSLAIQADGKVLAAGTFTNLCGQARTNIGRLNADGTLDASFNPGSDSILSALALQADGKIIVGGSFSRLGGELRSRLARLNSDGTLDPTFNPGANDAVRCLALQPNGAILAGGNFHSLGGATRQHLGRLNNPTAATQTLSFDGSDAIWLRGGSAPELWSVAFAVSTNGANWTDLGAGTRVPGGWRLSNVSATTNSVIRARGYVVGGEWFVEQTYALGPTTPPKIVTGGASFGFRSNLFGFDVRALPGQSVVIEASTNLLNWAALTTNTPDGGTLYFNDPASTILLRRFYRARLQ